MHFVKILIEPILNKCVIKKNADLSNEIPVWLMLLSHFSNKNRPELVLFMDPKNITVEFHLYYFACGAQKYYMGP